MRHIIFPILVVLNNPPNSAYATDTTTYFNIAHTLCITPLVLIGYIFLGILTNKYWPPILNRLFFVGYDASKCMFKIKSDLYYLMIALGFVEM